MARRNDNYSRPAFPVEQFVGLNNRAEPRAMAPGELVQADNIDVDDRRRVRRRRDARLALPLAGLTSAWSTPDEERLFMVAGGTLYEASGTALDVIELASGLSHDETHWTTDGERVFVSNPAGDLVVERGVSYPLAIPVPDVPLISTISGNLPAGRYLAAIVLEDSRGRQGGASGVVAVTVISDGAGLQFDLPTVPSGYTPRYYVSRTNDNVLRSASQQVRDVSELGAVLEESQYNGMPPPAGGPVAWHAGRLWKGVDALADGTGFVIASDPYWPQLFQFGAADFQVPGKVLALADVNQSALLIGTTRRVFAYNLDEGLRQVADYGVVAGHPCAVDDNGMVYLWTQRGVCRALPFENLTHAAVSAPGGERCAVGIVKQGGFERVVALTRVRASQGADNAR